VTWENRLVADGVEQLDELLSLRLATLGPSLELLTSRSSKSPLRSYSLSVPTAETSMLLNPLQRLVQVLIPLRTAPHVDEQLARQDVEAPLGHRLGPAELGGLVVETRVVKGQFAGLALVLVEVGSQVPRDEPGRRACPARTA
jgi:hypothetical protein